MGISIMANKTGEHNPINSEFFSIKNTIYSAKMNERLGDGDYSVFFSYLFTLFLYLTKFYKGISSYFLKDFSNCSFIDGLDKLDSFLYNLKNLYTAKGINMPNKISLKVSDSTSGSS